MAYQMYIQMLTLHMVQEFKVALGGFCFLEHGLNLLLRRAPVPSASFDAHPLFVDLAIHNAVVCIHPDCKRLDIFVLITKAYANEI